MNSRQMNLFFSVLNWFFFFFGNLVTSASVTYFTFHRMWMAGMLIKSMIMYQLNQKLFIGHSVSSMGHMFLKYILSPSSHRDSFREVRLILIKW